MNFFRNLPREMEEAAIVDGAGPWTMLFRIVVPCSAPVIATITLFVGVDYWNEYYNGMLLSTSEKFYPLMTYIKSLVVQMNTATNLTTEQMQRLASLSTDGLNAAKVFVALIPMLVVYPFLQRYFINGIMIGSVKE
jgi:multiple sugar transport system permease protein/putative aldouronate transport system permease protein